MDFPASSWQHRGDPKGSRMVPRILIASLFVAAVPAAAQAPDPVLGQKQFAQCAICHSAKAADPDRIGPNLFGSYGSKAATRRPNYAYSPALRTSKLTWNDATLDRWLADPRTTVKGSKMVVGQSSKAARANIIAYLKTLK